MSTTTSAITTRDLGDLEAITLYGGSHRAESHQQCFLEAAAWFANEPWSFQPVCVSPALRGFGIYWNDALALCGLTDELQELKRFIPRIIGTAGDIKRDVRRAEIAAAWARDVAVPAWKTYAAEYAAKYAAEYAAKSAAKYAAEYAAESAEYAAKSAAKSAAKYAAEYAAKSAEAKEVLRALHPKMCEVFEAMIIAE